MDSNKYMRDLLGIFTGGSLRSKRKRDKSFILYDPRKRTEPSFIFAIQRCVRCQDPLLSDFVVRFVLGL